MMRLEARGGGFLLRDDGAWRIEAVANGEAWTFRGPPPLAGLALFRSANAAGFVLGGAGGRDEQAARGRTFGGREPSGPERWLLLDDGSAWRLVLRGPRAARWELSGWETLGPYLLVRPADEAGAWEVERTVAGLSLPRAEELLVLAAAEITLAGAGPAG